MPQASLANDLAVPGQKVEAELAGGAFLITNFPAIGLAFLSLNFLVARLPAAFTGAQGCPSGPQPTDTRLEPHGLDDGGCTIRRVSVSAWRTGKVR
ncbi:MAG TPA: hypothetical protein VM142_12760 [Acidimicrobiales bacterium]|nr:hypothetical protein [Acidimicrobiales bacterium]